MVSKQVIELQQLRFRWPGQAQDCLAIEAFALRAGEHLFLHGPSGSGKSTLLGLLGGVLTPNVGTVHLLGQRLDNLPAAQRDRLRVEHIGFVFQQFNLVPYLNVLDNVLLPCRFSARRRARALAGGAPSLSEEAARLLGHLDLAPDHWHKPATALSVGQQQRVAAARALIGKPELLIADEPTSALDAERQQAFLGLLLREAAEAESTLLFVSHDKRLAEHFPRVLSLGEISRPAGAPA